MMWSGSRLVRSIGKGVAYHGHDHIAILEQFDGKTGDWMEKVAGEQYRK